MADGCITPIGGMPASWPRRTIASSVGFAAEAAAVVLAANAKYRQRWGLIGWTWRTAAECCIGAKRHSSDANGV